MDENAQLRQQLGYEPMDPGMGGVEPSTSVNVNGKRPMGDPALQYNDGMYANSYSSPRSAMTPNGPARLTLRQGQQPPTLTRQEQNGSDSLKPRRRQEQHDIRPGSSQRLVEQYAYQPPPTATRQAPPGAMSYAQGAPRMAHTNARDEDQPLASNSTMPPSGRFNPQPHATRSSKPTAPGSFSQARTQPHINVPPGASRPTRAAAPPGPPPSVRRPQNGAPQNSNRFMPPPPNPTQRLGPGATPVANRRFVPPTPSRGRFVPVNTPGSARGPPRTTQGSAAGGGQRMPFIPGRTADR